MRDEIEIIKDMNSIMDLCNAHGIRLSKSGKPFICKKSELLNLKITTK